ncbi:hypothetical protein [Bizionia sp.]|uniref:hypothetical protein n=1 Tax=Bizionia sp. TaxID=1954480 RepID=UPI003A92712B
MSENTLDSLFHKEDVLKKLPPLKTEHINSAIQVAEKYVESYKKQLDLTIDYDEKSSLVKEFKELCYKEVRESIKFDYDYWYSFTIFYDMKLSVMLKG